jgi:MFS transporter, FSR family, fosmidomycin resistance protein
MDKKQKFQWNNVIAISLAHLTHDIFSSFLAPLLPLLVIKLNFSYTIAGVLSIIQKIPNVLLSPFIGVMADKLKVRYLLIIAPAITTTAMSLLGIVPNLITLMILLFIMGIGSALFHVPAPVMIRKVAGKKVGTGMSFYMLGGEIARTLGPLLILAVVSWWGLSRTYLLIPIGWAASFYLYLRLRNITITDEFSHEKSKTVYHTFITYLPYFILLACILICRGFLKSAMTLFLPLYITTKGNSLWVAGLALSLLQFAGAVGTFFAGSVSDYLGRNKTLILICLITPILMFFFLIAKGAFLAVAIFMLGIFIFASGPVLLAQVHDIKTDRPSFINGIYMTTNFLTAAATAFGVGFFSDLIGIENIFNLTIFIALGAVPFAVGLAIVNQKLKGVWK